MEEYHIIMSGRDIVESLLVQRNRELNKKILTEFIVKSVVSQTDSKITIIPTRNILIRNFGLK